MATAQIGIRGNNAVVPYNAATKRTKQLTLTITSAQSGWSTTRAVGIVYADSAGTWRLRFNIAGSFTAVGAGALNFACTISNVITAATTQALAAVFTSATPVMRAYTSGSDGVLNVRAVDGTGADGVRIFGDIELSTEPTTLTVAANMEGAVNVDVYVPEASLTVPGIVRVGDQTFAGVKAMPSGIVVPPIKNYLINGGFDFWQRATSGSAPTNNNGSFIADRWRAVDVSQGYYGVARNATPVSTNSQYSVDCSTTNTGLQYPSNYHIIESADAAELVGQTVCFSIKAKRVGSFTAGNLRMGVAYLNTKDKAPSDYQNNSGTYTYTVIRAVDVQAISTMPTSMTTYYITVTIPASGANGLLVWVAGIALAASATGVMWNMGEAMLHVGTSPAPFSRAGRSLAGDLALAQRYFETSYPMGVVVGASDTPIPTRLAITSSEIVGSEFKVTKRDVPTVRFYSGDGTNAGTLGSVQLWNNGTTKANVNSVLEKTTFGISVLTTATVTAGSFYRYHWTADSEI